MKLLIPVLVLAIVLIAGCTWQATEINDLPLEESEPLEEEIKINFTCPFEDKLKEILINQATKSKKLSFATISIKTHKLSYNWSAWCGNYSINSIVFECRKIFESGRKTNYFYCSISKVSCSIPAIFQRENLKYKIMPPVIIDLDNNEVIQLKCEKI